MATNTPDDAADVVVITTAPEPVAALAAPLVEAPTSMFVLVDLPYTHHDVSSVLHGHDVGTGLGRGRMDSATGWTADLNDKSPWIRLDLETPEKVLGISSAGRGDRLEWVAQYRVEASVDGETWSEVRPQLAPGNLVFEGNVNYATRKDNFFTDGGVTSRFIRITPIHWVGPTAAMRVCLIMEPPVKVRIPVTITPFTDMPNNSLPRLEKDVPTPKERLYANWDGYDGEMEDSYENVDLFPIVPAIPSIAEIKKKRGTDKATKWVMAPINSSARRDKLQLLHWIQVSQKDLDYPFARLNKVLADIPVYTDDEYSKAIERASGDWTREDTDQLMELVRRFDRRFIVVYDRFSPSPTGNGVTTPRTIEDLKERYYKVCTLLRVHRAKSDDMDDETNNIVPYDAAHEKLRKKQLTLLLSRTVEELEEEEFVVGEMKKLNQRHKKEKDRDRDYLFDLAPEPVQPYSNKDKDKARKKSRKDGEGADSEPLLKKLKKGWLKREESQAFSPASDVGFATPGALNFSAGGPGRKASSVTLSSARFLQPYQMQSKTTKKIVAVYESHGIVLEKLMPSAKVVSAANQMKAEVLDLIDAQRQVDKLDAEVKLLRSRLNKTPAPSSAVGDQPMAVDEPPVAVDDLTTTTSNGAAPATDDAIRDADLSTPTAESALNTSDAVGRPTPMEASLP